MEVPWDRMNAGTTPILHTLSYRNCLSPALLIQVTTERKNMRKNTLAKLLACLETLEPRVELAPEIMERALLPLERMLAVK